jgi:gliding motility-associated-like protein
VAQEEVTANNDLIVMFENQTSIANILNNDYGISDGVKSLRITTEPKNGFAIVNQNNTISYTPDLYFIGSDVFEYEVCNISGNCDKAIVEVQVLDYDFKPIAIDDEFYIEFGKVQLFDILKNDQNLFDIPLSLTITRHFNHGNSIVTSDLMIETVFTSLFTTTDSLIYQVCDADGDCSTATVRVYHYTDLDRDTFIPQGFSPDGDGINDTFFIPDYIYLTGVTVTIVNRNGILVYQDNNFVQWNGIANAGTLKGKTVPAGVYYYQVNVPGLNRTNTGYIYLAR